MGTENTASISVIVPMYNAASTIADCLDPLLAMKQRGEVEEIIVVDDCSTDRSPKIVNERDARLIRTSGQAGPGAARNLAAEAARGSILWFVDADVIVRQDAGRWLVSGFDSADVAAVFGSYDDSPAASGFLSQYKNLVHRYYHQRGQSDSSTFWAGCGAVRKDVFLELGGFDTDRYPYPSIEDIELGKRIRRSGARIRLLPDLQGKHLKEWKLGNLVHTEIFRRAIPWSRLMLSDGELTNDLNVSTGERLRALVAALFVLSVLIAAFGWIGWPVVIGFAILIVVLNFDFLRFFARERGWPFALGALCYHQIYYLYSLGAFSFAWVEHQLDSRIPRAR